MYFYKEMLEIDRILDVKYEERIGLQNLCRLRTWYKMSINDMRFTV